MPPPLHTPLIQLAALCFFGITSRFLEGITTAKAPYIYSIQSVPWRQGAPSRLMERAHAQCAPLAAPQPSAQAEVGYCACVMEYDSI